MIPDFEEVCRSLGMTEIIRLQSVLSLVLRQRFERKGAIAFSDIVGSTRYFSTFGDEAGRRLQQRHVDLLQRALAGSGGWIVDTAGDGAFLFFPDMSAAAGSLVDFMRLVAADNADRERDHRLAIRVGIHYGSVLSDGVQVTGDAVNFCSRVVSSAEPSEIRLTKDAFHACVETEYRSRCHVLPPATFNGVAGGVELLSLRWRDDAVFPTRVLFETGEVYVLPEQDVISFGRQATGGAAPGNDIVLRGANEDATKAISRWHFQLLRRADGVALRALTDALTEVNGGRLARGEEVAIWPGDRVRVGGVLTLSFEAPGAEVDRTVIAADSRQGAGGHQSPGGAETPAGARAEGACARSSSSLEP